MYFNYHAKVKKLINEGELLFYSYYKNYNNISPALVLFFKNHKPMPIRSYRFNEYIPLLKGKKFIKSDDIHIKNMKK